MAQAPAASLASAAAGMLTPCPGSGADGWEWGVVDRRSRQAQREASGEAGGPASRSQVAAAAFHVLWMRGGWGGCCQLSLEFRQLIARGAQRRKFWMALGKSTLFCSTRIPQGDQTQEYLFTPLPYTETCKLWSQR